MWSVLNDCSSVMRSSLSCFGLSCDLPLTGNDQFIRQKKIHNGENRRSLSVDDVLMVVEEEKRKKGLKKSKSVCVRKNGLSERERLERLMNKHRKTHAEILHDCAEFDKKNSASTSLNKPDKFPNSDDVQLRRSETLVDVRKKHARTVHETTNTRKCLTFNGPYKLKSDNKTMLRVENGFVEVKEHEIRYWNAGNLTKTEIMIDGFVETDKQLSYKTRDKVKECIKERVVSFKTPLTKEQSILDSRSFLRKFLRRRSAKHLLETKGILKNENVFGNKLTVLKEKFGQAVPPFVRTIMSYIEQDENIKTEHIYRISGNLAVIQKIRLQIDDSNFKILEKHVKDIEVLTGTLKLFYRELVEPVLPYKDFEMLNKILDKNFDGEEKSRQVVDIVDNIDSPHKENLKDLINHLLKIESNGTHNKMNLKSLSIVWGPSIIWHQQEKCPDYNAFDFSLLANDIVELILTSHKAVPRESTENSSAEIAQPKQKISHPKQDQMTKEKITRSFSNEENVKSPSVASKVGGIFGLKKSESKEVLSGSSWSLSSFGSESKKTNENPFYGFTFDMLSRRDEENIPWIINEMIRLIENKPDVKDLYITSYSKDYMGKFRKRINRNKQDISKMEPLDLAIILVRILRELHDKLIPEEVFIDYCDNYERLNTEQRRQYLEETLQNLPEVKKRILERIMDHLFKIFECQNRLPIVNVWLPVFCSTTQISEQSLSFTKLIFDSFERKKNDFKEGEKTFEYKVKIQKEEGGLKTIFQENTSRENVKDGYSNAQLNSIADSLEKNAPHTKKYSNKWKNATKKI